MLPPAVFILGPTASGKTAVSLALAERFPVEIISVDSAQVYVGMDVGTAKPDAATRARIRHHLIDIVPPTEPYSAGRFREDALRLAGEVAMRGRVALFIGGTMLYERALARGLAALPAANPGLRSRLDARARASGWPALHAELARVDPATAARLEPTDAQRIQRALEVFEATGTPLSILHARAGSAPAPLRGMRIALEPSDRTVLHERIAWRFREMLANGLLAEVEELRRRHALHAGLPSMRAVGYRQAWEVLEGTSPASALAERGIAATRQLAKRQLTWLRSRTDVERLDCLRADLADAVSSKVARFLEGNAQSSP